MNQNKQVRSVSKWAEKITRLLALTMSAICLVPPFASAERSESEAAPGQYVIQLKRERSHYQRGSLEKQLQARIVDVVRSDLIVIQREASETAEAALRSLREAPSVRRAEPNFIYRIVRVPNDADYGRLWGLSNGGDRDSAGTRGIKGIDIGAEKAWDITTGSKNVIVAVIDTGVDFRVPDLASNKWVNTAELNGLPGVDDDKNGFVDDIHGYNFVSNKGDSTDDNEHGTHCAGTIGGAGNDGRGVVGVNWDVSIMALKFLDASGGGTLANAIRAIDYATKMGAHVMSNSWGGGSYSVLLEESIEKARDAGILFIAAAGNSSSNNDSFPSYPASYTTDNVVSVAAIDNRGVLASFSNYGVNTVHLAAPGVNIYSTVPSGFDTFSGTSMATPHVAGVAALLLADKPGQKYSELKDRLLTSARPLAGLRGKVKTGGMVDAYYALAGLSAPADPNDPANWSNHLPYQLSTSHPYANGLSETYTVHIPGAKRISVRFPKFDTENGYDKVQFFNGAGESLGNLSGKRDGIYAPVAEGDTLVLKFTTDGSVTAYGFDVDMVSYE